MIDLAAIRARAALKRRLPTDLVSASTQDVVALLDEIDRLHAGMLEIAEHRPMSAMTRRMLRELAAPDTEFTPGNETAARLKQLEGELRRIRSESLTWAMVCDCNCVGCCGLYELIRRSTGHPSVDLSAAHNEKV